MSLKLHGIIVLAAAILLTSGVVRAADNPQQDNKSRSITEIIDSGFGQTNKVLENIFFFDVSGGTLGTDRNGKPVSVPFVIFWLVVGAIYFSVRMGFIGLRVFAHAVQCLRGKYSKKGDAGEVTHFQALSTALSATVGLGNIAGVAIAIGLGGPGATFWMIVAGLLAMTLKFTEATAAQMYRETRPDGHVMGGAMEYLSRGFKEVGMGPLGKILAILFCIFCIGASLGGGNAFQISQSQLVVTQVISDLIPAISPATAYQYRWIYGVVLVLMVGVVIIGGLRRIAHTAEAIVPFMVLLYVATCLWIIGMNFSAIPAAFALIFTEAFSLQAGIGGMIGVMIAGFRRAAFSNEAGIGSAAIAHATAKTAYPIRQGIVASLEPFIDTVVICTMTALVIVITSHYLGAPGLSAETKLLIEQGGTAAGAQVTAIAFKSQVTWFPYILAVCVFLFAYSTMISWSYYGERCWSYIFGEKSAIIYKLIFLLFIMLGSLASVGNILDFTDYLFFAMALPNLIALYLLQNKIARALKDYLAKLRSGELDREVGRT